MADWLTILDKTIDAVEIVEVQEVTRTYRKGKRPSGVFEDEYKRVTLIARDGTRLEVSREEKG